MTQSKNDTLTQEELLDAIDHNPKRLENETFDNYKLRRKMSKFITRGYLKGRPVINPSN